MGLKLKRIDTVNELKALENGTTKTKYIGGYKWTKDKILILREDGETHIADKWFINYQNEVIWSNKNDYFDFEMYERNESFIKDCYCIEED